MFLPLLGERLDFDGIKARGSYSPLGACSPAERSAFTGQLALP